MPTDFSQVYRFMSGLIREAERSESALKALAHRRALAVHRSAQNRLPQAGEGNATGKTRAALHVVDDSARKQYRVEVADIPGRDPMVPVYLEFGTVGMSARPFLRPAVDENRDGYRQDAERIIADLDQKALK